MSTDPSSSSSPSLHENPDAQVESETSPSEASSQPQESPSPEETTEEHESAASTAASGEVPEEEKPRAGQRVMIGSQRPGAPKIKAQAPPVPQLPTEKQAEPKQAEPKPDATPSEAAAESKPAEAAESAGEDSSAEGEAGVKIGTQRPGSQKIKAKAQFESKAEAERPPVERVPLPNLRRPLSSDLEAELEESLGDMSLDSLVEGHTRGPELETNSQIQATISRIQLDDVFLDLGQRNQGVVAAVQFKEAPEVGQSIEVIVTRYDTADGLYYCSLPGEAADVGDWSSVSEGMVVDARITGHNKGGLECQVNNLRGFIPASQVAQFRIEDFSEFVGQTLTCMVTEVNPQRRNLVLSRRSLIEREQAEAREKLVAELAPGQVREGIVRNIRDFGAFVDLGGVDGLLHVSQLSWTRVNHPSEVLELGQKVKVKIQKIDPTNGKISLAMKDLMASPWDTVKDKFYEGATITGTVTKVMDFGAFVELEPGVEGLVHISELAHHRVFRTSDIVKEGDQVEAKVLSLDLDKQRISLSMKAMMAAPVKEKKEPEEEEFIPPPTKPSKRRGPLKGGLGRGTGGEDIGLNW